MLAARARALKTAPFFSDDQRTRLRLVLQRFPAWVSTQRPAHVPGLAAEHLPHHGSWEADAREHWAALGAELTDDGTPYGAPRSSPRAPPSSRGDGSSASGAREELPEDWVGWPLYRWKRAAMAGGTPREEARAEPCRSLRLAELDWPEIAHTRRLEALFGRIDSGSVDVVVLIQNLLSHAAADAIVAACKNGEAPFVLSQGYGLAAARAATEKLVASVMR